MTPSGELSPLVVIPNVVWDGRPESSSHTLHYLAMGWGRSGRHALVVNLLDWRRLRRWPKSVARYWPGLHSVSSHLKLLNLYGADWRQRVGAERPVPARQVADAIARAAGSAPTVLFGEPSHARLASALPHARLVYFAVDDYAAGDPTAQSLLLREERSAIQAAELTLAVSPPLVAKLRGLGAQPRLMPNAVNGPELRAMSGGAPLRSTQGKPVVVYVGELGARCELAAMVTVVAACPQLEFRFVGPVGKLTGEAETALRALLALPNVVALGPRDRRGVAQQLSQAHVAWIPYRLDGFNLACSPLKAYEYGAFQLPVLSTPLPALAHSPVRVAPIEEHAAELLALLGSPETGVACGDWAAANDWTARADTLARALVRVDDNTVANSERETDVNTIATPSANTVAGSVEAHYARREETPHHTYRGIPMLCAEGLHEAVLARLERLVPRGARVLDAGCGQGALSQRLADHGYAVEACDLLDHFKPKGIPFHRVGASESGLGADFDAVLAIELVEHTASPFQLLAEYARRLRPGGLLVVSTPHVDSDFSRLWFLLKGRHWYFEDRHVREDGHISPIHEFQLREAAAQLGLEVVQSEGVLENRSVQFGALWGFYHAYRAYQWLRGEAPRDGQVALWVFRVPGADNEPAHGA